MSYAIERLDESLVTEAALLRRQTWGGPLAANEEYLRWKYLESPYVPEPLLFLALHDGRAVAMRGLHGTCWEIGPGGARHVFPATSDSTIEGAHREAGLFQELGTACIEGARRQGFTHLVNPTSGENALAHVLTFGWRPSAPQGPMVRPAASASTISRARRRARRHLSRGRQLPGPLHRLDGCGGVHPEGRLEVRADPPPDDLVLGLAASDAEPLRLRPVRDAAFLGWRFRNPFLVHRFLHLESDDGAALLVLGGSTAPGRVMILDWIGAVGARQRLLRLAARLLPEGELGIWAGTLGSHDRAALTAAGFAPVAARGSRERYAQRMLVRPTDDDADDDRWTVDGLRVDAPESWSLHALSSDIF